MVNKITSNVVSSVQNRKKSKKKQCIIFQAYSRVRKIKSKSPKKHVIWKKVLHASVEDADIMLPDLKDIKVNITTRCLRDNVYLLLNRKNNYNKEETNHDRVKKETFTNLDDVSKLGQGKILIPTEPDIIKDSNEVQNLSFHESSLVFLPKKVIKPRKMTLQNFILNKIIRSMSMLFPTIELSILSLFIYLYLFFDLNI